MTQADDASDRLADAWRTNCRINAILLDAITPEGMDATLSTRGGRGVAGEFAHMHNIRVWHIEGRAKQLATGLCKLDTKPHPSRATLKKALKSPDKAVETFLCDVLAGVPKRRGFRKGIFTTLSYFISHEAHHRGRILLTLKVSGNTLDKAVQSRIWGWDQIEV